MKQKIAKILILLTVLQSVAFALPPSANASQIAISGEAKVLNTGYYLDFTNENSNVKVDSSTGKFTGYVFSDDLGWIDFGTTDNAQGPVYVDLATGYLKGKAYVLNTQNYIDFEAENSNARIEGATFSGYVFSIDAGWIDFSDTGVSAASAFMENPTASWGFNENYGQTINDSSPYAHDGTRGADSGSSTDDPTWTQKDLCVADSCLSFDGGDYVNVSTAVLDVKTVSFWVRPKTDSEVLLDLDGGSHKLTSSSGTITATGFSNVYVNAQVSTTIVANQWQHIVATTSSSFDASAITLGKVSTSYLTGFMDEVRLFGTQKSADQVKGLYAAKSSPKEVSSQFGPGYEWMSNGLVGYWKMDEATGDASDSSGVGNTLTNNGTTTYVGGKYGNGSEHVPASSQYFSTVTTINNVKTVSFWVNPDSNSNYYLSLTTTDYITSSSGTISVTGFGSNEKVFVNGVETTSISANSWQLITITTDTAINANQFYVGRQGSNYFDGTMDEVRLYNRALTPSEVEGIYNWGPGPVGYWKLDENTGTTAYDSSGNGNTSSAFTGNTTWAIGKYGSGLTFDGTDDVVRVVESTSTDIGATTDSYTVEGFINTTTNYSANASIFAKNDATGAYPFDLYLNSSEFACFQISDGTLSPSTCSSTALNDGNWHHIVGKRDVGADTIYIFVDGVQINSTADTTTVTTANNDDLSIGNAGASYTGADFNGMIDDVRIYNYARTSGQIVEDMNAGHPIGGSPLPSQLGYWKFDEGYGDTAYDSGSGGNNGDLAGSGSTCPQSGDSACPTWTNSGYLGKALDFDTAGATDDYVEGSNSFVSDYPFTLSAWINTTQTTTGYVLYLTDASASNVNYYIGHQNGGNYAVMGAQNTITQEIEGTVDINDGNWHHIVGVFASETDRKLYVDGLLEGTDSTSVSYNTNVDSWCVGRDCDSSPGSYFDGTVDEVKFYSAALTTDEVKSDMNQGKAAVLGSSGTDSLGNATFSAENEYCPPGQGSSCTPPVGEWKFDEKTGSTANNTSGGNFAGTLTNSPVWTHAGECQKGACLTLNGSSSYVDIGTGPSTVRGVSFWVYPETTTEYFINVNADPTYISASAGTVSATGFAGATIYVDGVTTSTIVADKWQHVVVTTATTENASDFDIGRTQGTNYLEGKIDEVHLFDYQLSQAQVSYLYNRGATVGWWKLDECSGTVAYDASGNGNNGTITPNTGNATGTCGGSAGDMWADGATGKRNASLAFDGTDDYVDIGDTGFTTVRVVSFWAKPSTTTQEFLQLSATNTVEVSSGTISVGGFGSESVYIDGKQTTSFPDTNWHHVLVISSTDITADNMDIGRISTNYGAGQIDEVKIYNYAPTLQQIRNDYNQGAVRYGPAEGSP